MCARTTAKYEKELSGMKEEDEPQRQLVDAVRMQPRVVLHRADVAEELRPERQEPEPPHIKEEVEDEEVHHIKQEEEVVTKFPLTCVPLKSEDGLSEESRGVELPSSSSSQHMTTEGDGDHCGGPQADSLLTPLSDCDDVTSHSPHTDDEQSEDITEELRPEQQEPKPPHIKEEVEDEEVHHIKQEEEEEVVTKFPLTCVPLKSEDEGQSEESRGVELPSSSSSQHMTTEDDGDHCGGPQAASLLTPLSECDDVTSHSPHTDDDDEQSEGGMTCHTEEKQWKCSQCMKPFANQSNLKQHTRTHTGEKPFPCTVCGQRFTQKEHLKIHTRTHTGEKPFSCTVCGKKFSDKGSLIKHTRTHTGEKPFSCSVCGLRFAVKGSFKRHTRTHTNEKPFSCSICGQRFSVTGSLQRHTRTHTGEKPFSCSVCGRRFSEKGNLKRHTRKHSGEKPFSCSVCGQRFSYKYQAKTHKCAGENSSDQEAFNENVNVSSKK
ncbi:zinc finger and SCAN domain-containing protein 2-like isoform X1 [Phyllopteryx taeniolatus]|uniref:zinc finger and SCAN domain-containing protein 2-like isoform X1 n=1 Tax=Phyllopteryx taeniolatus TaxID=161469 RepID=UPI002AD58AD0|nr:zinc finger and SCAN domain-containing protein 2-like isoform X1 [Phyllopteryx taeniolatus]